MEDLKKQFELLNKTGNVPLGGFKKEDFQLVKKYFDNKKKTAI